MGHSHENIKDCCSKCSSVDHLISNQHADASEEHGHSNFSFSPFLLPLFSFLFLLLGIYLDSFLQPKWFEGWLRFVFYLIAYLPVGFDVLRSAYDEILRRNFFSEFFLMSIATLGAFALQEYAEAVAVMLFYTVGENFQDLAIQRAKGNIRNLLDQRPQYVTVRINDSWVEKAAKDVQVGDIIQVSVGEKLALDGVLLSNSGSFDTAALTGEAVPDTKYEGEELLAGMINMSHVIQMQVKSFYQDSKLSKILGLVQEANARKAPAELFIRRFAKVYTPIVVLLAVLIIVVPYFIVGDYFFRDWLYKALIFLVISCPCALVISIPLGYFGGIGAASRHGILVKGGNYLDLLAKVTDVVMDKTGTLTKAVFEVQQINLSDSYDSNEILSYIAQIEETSTHPIAKAIVKYIADKRGEGQVSSIEEIPGKGLKGLVNGKVLLVGNFKLLDSYSITYPATDNEIPFTTVAVALNGEYLGYIVIADQLKADAKHGIDLLKRRNISTTIFSGDKSAVVSAVASTFGIERAYGELLPKDKLVHLQSLKKKDRTVAFVGDGINDAPVLAGADIGIAMGGLGADASIETADIVIQDDKPSKVSVGIDIAKATKRIVWQNIILAFSVKLLVLILGAGGVATMWEAIFADVGVALLAILNAIRILNSNFLSEK